MPSRCTLFFLAIALLALLTGPAQAIVWDWGPLASRIDDVTGADRLEALGPLYESATATNGMRFRAVRPFYGRFYDPGTGREYRDYLWPVGTAKRERDGYHWRFLLTFYHDFDTTDPRSRYRFWSLPLYFQGRDINRDRYAAVFPLGGNIKEFLGRDDIRFVLFPLWMRSSINDVVTTDYLWPIVSTTHGKGIERFRIFPFYGRNVHRDLYDKRFVLWPIWNWAKYKKPGSSGTGYILFPLWGHVKLEDQETWFILPPFIRFTHGARLNYNYCPWPFVQWSSGQVEKLYLWPLWGHKASHGVRSGFFLWPFFSTETMDRGREVGQRFNALPFIFSEIRTARPPPDLPKQRGEVVYRYHKLWPLMSYLRDGDRLRFRMLDLWFLKDTAPMERCWCPLWTVYAHRRSGVKTEDELLWGLWRHEREGGAYRHASLFPLFSWTRDDRAGPSREWNVLKGLAGCRQEGAQKRYRVLYFFRFGGKEERP